MRKTYRIKLQDEKTVYRTDGVPTNCCSFQTDFFIWERNSKHNNYNGYSGYIPESDLKNNLKKYNPDNLELDGNVKRLRQVRDALNKCKNTEVIDRIGNLLNV